MDDAPGTWPRDAGDLIAAQERLADARPPAWRVPERPLRVGGVWVCFPRGYRGRGAAGDPAWAAAALGERVAVVDGVAGAPYEPGLLALREGPLLEAAVRALGETPDVLLVDGTGRDHPRRAGLALHLGAVLGVPTVGVTDRPLVGLEHAAAVEVRRGARPLIVHPAWRTDLETAVAVVRAAHGGARTPEPLRRARRAARSARARAGR